MWIQGSAKRLVKAALHEAARKREMRYSDLYKIDKKVRRHFHDDITVIVLFLNHNLISRGAVLNTPLTIRSASISVEKDNNHKPHSATMLNFILKLTYLLIK